MRSFTFAQFLDATKENVPILIIAILFLVAVHMTAQHLVTNAWLGQKITDIAATAWQAVLLASLVMFMFMATCFYIVGCAIYLVLTASCPWVPSVLG